MPSNTRVSIIVSILDQRIRPQAMRNLIPQITNQDELILITPDSLLPQLMLNLHQLTGNIKVILLKDSQPTTYYQLLNQAATEATGQYLAFFCSHSPWLPGKLSAQLYALETQRLDFICTNYNLHLGSKGAGKLAWKATSGNPRAGFTHCLLHQNFVRLGSVMLKKSAWQKGNGFPDYLGEKSELALWLSLTSQITASVLNEPLTAVYSTPLAEQDRARDHSAVLSAFVQSSEVEPQLRAQIQEHLGEGHLMAGLKVVQGKIRLPWKKASVLTFPLD